MVRACHCQSEGSISNGLRNIFCNDHPFVSLLPHSLQQQAKVALHTTLYSREYLSMHCITGYEFRLLLSFWRMWLNTRRYSYSWLAGQCCKMPPPGCLSVDHINQNDMCNVVSEFMMKDCVQQVWRHHYDVTITTALQLLNWSEIWEKRNVTWNESQCISRKEPVTP